MHDLLNERGNVPKMIAERIAVDAAFLHNVARADLIERLLGRQLPPLRLRRKAARRSFPAVYQVLR